MKEKKMKILSDLDYVELYAQKLKEDNRFFKQQAKLINSQIKSSSSIFKNTFSHNFKGEAREYLRGIKLIK